jgi:hypothetical protein
MKKLLILTLAGFVLVLAGCQDDAQLASHNISKAADNFEIQRRIVFINGITDRTLLTMEGRCSTKADRADNQIEITCKVGPNTAIRNTMGLSDNVTYVIEQMDPASVSFYHYRRTFKPQSVIPDIDFRFDGKEIITNSSEAMQ